MSEQPPWVKLIPSTSRCSLWLPHDGGLAVKPTAEVVKPPRLTEEGVRATLQWTTGGPELVLTLVHATGDYRYQLDWRVLEMEPAPKHLLLLARDGRALGVLKGEGWARLRALWGGAVDGLHEWEEGRTGVAELLDRMSREGLGPDLENVDRLLEEE